MSKDAIGVGVLPSKASFVEGMPRGTYIVAGENSVMGEAKLSCSLDACIRRKLCAEVHRPK